MGKGLIQGGILEPKLWNIGYEEVLKKFNKSEILNKYHVFLWKKVLPDEEVIAYLKGEYDVSLFYYLNRSGGKYIEYWLLV